MIASILAAYFYCLAACFLSTVLLILSGLSWGALPHKYLQAVLFLQGFVAKIECNSNLLERARRLDMFNPSAFLDLDFHLDQGWKFIRNGYKELSSPALLTKDFNSGLSNELNGRNLAFFNSAASDIQLHLVRRGMESIVDDEISPIFGFAHDYQAVKSSRQLSIAIRAARREAPKIALLVGSFGFRFLFLFPLRLALILTSFVFIGSCCILACFVSLSDRSKTKIAVIYCRLYTAGTGLVANYYNAENRPKRPGVAVSNHLSPNDIQIICADVDPNRKYLYIVTGQKHHGIIWAIERLVERLCPCLWLERTDVEERKLFTKSVLDTAISSGPVLIFPEGYCTNNSRVLLFRKAVFEPGVTVYPIAIKQDARFGDNYWSEDYFYHYLLRLLTSWANVYEVFYLPPQHRRENESGCEFAARVQTLIAEQIGVEPCLDFDAGSLWYKKSVRDKWRTMIENEVAKKIVEIERKQLLHSNSIE